jgi:hypothetical protein
VDHVMDKKVVKALLPADQSHFDQMLQPLLGGAKLEQRFE